MIKLSPLMGMGN